MNEIVAITRMTPLNHEYPTCERTCAELRIYPSALRHEDVSAIMGLQPSEAQNSGDSIQTVKGTLRMANRTYWALSSEGLVSSRDTRAHLDWLLALLYPAAAGLRQLQSDGGNKMFVCCPWWSRSGHGGPTLWPEQMKSLSELNLECSFDIQFHGDD